VLRLCRALRGLAAIDSILLATGGAPPFWLSGPKLLYHVRYGSHTEPVGLGA